MFKSCFLFFFLLAILLHLSTSAPIFNLLSDVAGNAFGTVASTSGGVLGYALGTATGGSLGGQFGAQVLSSQGKGIGEYVKSSTRKKPSGNFVDALSGLTGGILGGTAGFSGLVATALVGALTQGTTGLVKGSIEGTSIGKGFGDIFFEDSPSNQGDSGDFLDGTLHLVGNIVGTGAGIGALLAAGLPSLLSDGFDASLVGGYSGVEFGKGVARQINSIFDAAV